VVRNIFSAKDAKVRKGRQGISRAKRETFLSGTKAELCADAHVEAFASFASLGVLGAKIV
jgi:hypothetical protein